MGELYELEPVPQTPRLPGSVVLRRTPDEVVDAIAADLLIHAHGCVRTFGDFHLALSGGSTPTPLYLRLMYDPSYREMPWSRTHLWIVDERRVPFDDDRSNFKHINEIIGDHSGIPREQVHPIFALADDADAQYERTIQETLAWREKGQDRLDYVLLGMGNDAHTASLFPRSRALRDTASLVRINAGPEVTPPDRVTMTLRLINSARFLSVMVTGESKRPTVARVAAAARQGRPSPAIIVDDLPILGVNPVGGELRWYLDYAACPGAPEPT
jgi:6-phosphogluconolactonase